MVNKSQHPLYKTVTYIARLVQDLATSLMCVPSRVNVLKLLKMTFYTSVTGFSVSKTLNGLI